MYVCMYIHFHLKQAWSKSLWHTSLLTWSLMHNCPSIHLLADKNIVGRKLS